MLISFLLILCKKVVITSSYPVNQISRYPDLEVEDDPLDLFFFWEGDAIREIGEKKWKKRKEIEQIL